MKYKIIQKNNFYYPQFKKYLFWQTFTFNIFHKIRFLHKIDAKNYITAVEVVGNLCYYDYNTEV